MILWSWRERISVRKIGAGKWLGSLEDSGYMGDDLSREMALGTGRQGISPAKTGAWKWLWNLENSGYMGDDLSREMAREGGERNKTGEPGSRVLLLEYKFLGSDLVTVTVSCRLFRRLVVGSEEPWHENPEQNEYHSCKSCQANRQQRIILYFRPACYGYCQGNYYQKPACKSYPMIMSCLAGRDYIQQDQRYNQC